MKRTCIIIGIIISIIVYLIFSISFSVFLIKSGSLFIYENGLNIFIENNLIIGLPCSLVMLFIPIYNIFSAFSLNVNLVNCLIIYVFTIMLILILIMLINSVKLLQNCYRHNDFLKKNKWILTMHMIINTIFAVLMLVFNKSIIDLVLVSVLIMANIIYIFAFVKRKNKDTIMKVAINKNIEEIIPISCQNKYKNLK